MLELSQRLIGIASEPFLIDDESITVGASIGIAFGAGGESAIGELIREADIALYQAKHDGRGHAEIFDPSLLEPDARHPSRT